MSTFEQVNKVLRKRNLIFLAGLGVFLLVFVVSSLVTEFDLIESFASFPKAISWLAANFVPDAKAISRLPVILTRLGETVLVSVMATSTAGVVALVLALLGAKPTRPHPAATTIVRGIASFFRNIPSAVWALVFVLTIGQTMFTGFLALFLETLGFLVRAYIDTIEETASSSIEALQASGAHWSQTISQSIIPSSSPQMLSWLLYLLETNIRSATLVGMLTATGIGYLFDLYYKQLNYPSAALVIITIVVVVFLLELISNRIRKVIL